MRKRDGTKPFWLKWLVIKKGNYSGIFVINQGIWFRGFRERVNLNNELTNLGTNTKNANFLKKRFVTRKVMKKSFFLSFLNTYPGLFGKY